MSKIREEREEREKKKYILYIYIKKHDNYAVDGFYTEPVRTATEEYTEALISHKRGALDIWLSRAIVTLDNGV